MKDKKEIKKDYMIDNFKFYIFTHLEHLNRNFQRWLQRPDHRRRRR